MTKGGPSNIREAIFKATHKEKENDDFKEMGYISNEEEENFVIKLQVGTNKFRGKLPFKKISYRRVGHYVVKFPYKENNEKGNNSLKVNVI